MQTSGTRSRKFSRSHCNGSFYVKCFASGACGWSVVPLDHGGKRVPMDGVYGLVDSGIEVHSTIENGALQSSV